MILDHSTRLEALVNVVAHVIVLWCLLFKCLFLRDGTLGERRLDSQADEFGGGRSLQFF